MCVHWNKITCIKITFSRVIPEVYQDRIASNQIGKTVSPLDQIILQIFLTLCFIQTFVSNQGWLLCADKDRKDYTEVCTEYIQIL